MKVNLEQKCKSVNSPKTQTACQSLKPDCTERDSTFEANASCCSEAYGRAMVSMQGSKKPQKQEELAEIITEIICGSDMQIARIVNDSHIRIGRPVEGFKELFYDDMRAKCIRDENGFISSIYTLDMQTGEVNVYDSNANLKKRYTPQEMKALKEYKYTVDELHNFLRHGKIKGFNTQESFTNLINTLDSLYRNDQKHMQTTENLVLYRALQTDLSDKEKDTLTTIGGVYTDKSYVSTTTDINVAQRFQSPENPILKIDIPKGTKYLDMDALFNIDRRHWDEKEYLLNRNSRFEVTGFDVLNNIINVKYIGD